MRNASPTFRRRRIAATLALTAVPSAASAGAWTLPQGEGQIIQTFSGWVGWSDPIRYGGREDKIETQSYVQYGLTDRLTVIGELSIERYALSAPRDVYAGFDTTGAGLRARLWSNDSWAFAVEGTGFYGGASNSSRPAQAGGAGPAADARALLGHNLTLLGYSAFFDAEAGYRLRTEGPPSEWKADVTLGVDWNPKTQLLLQSFNTISQGPGTDGFPSWEEHKGQVSVVYALDKKWAVQVGGFSTLWRRSSTSEYGAVLAVWRNF